MVVLDGSGEGDARTMAEALLMVREGGTIHVRPGQYPENVRITQSVTVVGDRDGSSQAVFQNIVINTTGSVRLETIRIEASGLTGALLVQGGDVELVECTVLNPIAARSGRRMTTAVFVTNGRLRIEGGTIGPGGNAAMVVSEDARMLAQGATFVGDAGYGLYGAGHSQIRVGGSTISGQVAVAAGDQVSLLLSGNTLIGSPGQYVVSLSDEVVPEIVNNRFAIVSGGRRIDATERNWLRVAPTILRTSILGNRSGNGRHLGPRNPSR